MSVARGASIDTHCPPVAGAGKPGALAQAVVSVDRGPELNEMDGRHSLKVGFRTAASILMSVILLPLPKHWYHGTHNKREGPTLIGLVRPWRLVVSGYWSVMISLREICWRRGSAAKGWH